MKVSAESGRFGLCARLLALVAGSMLLANCSGTSRLDPKWGVASSPRVIGAGEDVPKGGGKYRVGKPYTVGGRVYVPEEDVNYKAEGLASWYGDDFHGRYTANGEIFDMNSITAAHPTMPLPSYARVTNLRNNKSMVVRVNDRGPYVGNRVIDLSVRVAKLLEFHGNGVTKVKVEYVGRAPLAGSDDKKLVATLRDGNEAPARVQVASSNSKEFAPYFDSKPMSSAPKPSARPAPAAQQVAAVEETDDDEAPAPVRVMASAANTPSAIRARTVETAAPASAPAATPVSAYAATRYDSRAGFMSGRGLY